MAGCVETLDNPVAFDQLIESTTFENRLLTKVAIFRDGVAIDTLGARQSGFYPVGRKGAVRHAWRIIAPIDNSGNPAGEQPTEDLGVQYRTRATYTIDNDALSDGTLFTPRIVNLSFYSLRITANYGTGDQFSTDYTVRPNDNIPDVTSPNVHAPYFYWNSSSNIVLSERLTGRTYAIYRDDSTSLGTLRLDNRSEYDGTGLTEAIVVDP